MSDDEKLNRGLIANVRSLPAKTAVLRRGIELADRTRRKWTDDAKRRFEMLGECLPEATPVVLTLPELSPSTLPHEQLDRPVAALKMLRLHFEPGNPLTETTPILTGEAENGTHIEVFASWCRDWRRLQHLTGGRIAGRVKTVMVSDGDTIHADQAILTAELTSNSELVALIEEAANARLLEGVEELFTDYDEVRTTWGKLFDDNRAEIFELWMGRDQRESRERREFAIVAAHVLGPKVSPTFLDDVLRVLHETPGGSFNKAVAQVLDTSGYRRMG